MRQNLCCEQWIVGGKLALAITGDIGYTTTRSSRKDCVSPSIGFVNICQIKGGLLVQLLLMKILYKDRLFEHLGNYGGILCICDYPVTTTSTCFVCSKGSLALAKDDTNSKENPVYSIKGLSFKSSSL